MTPGTQTTTTRRGRSRGARIAWRMAVMLLLVGLLAAALIGFQVFKAGILKKVIHQITSQVPVVATTTATTSEWQRTLAATGTLRASRGTDLAAEVAGIVDQIGFASGQDVAAGTVLLRLRPNDDAARLAQLEAAANLAQITYDRDRKQLRAQAVAQSTVDTDAANLASARAQVAAQQALMDEKIVRAPFAGRLGIRLVDLGQYLAPGTSIVTLQALDPMFLDFYLPQQVLGEVHLGQKVVVRVDTYPKRDFAGTVSAINARVNATNRMVQVRATLQNPDRALLPGMFVTVSLAIGVPRPEVTIPNSAVTYNPYGSVVFVIHHNGTDEAGKPKLIARQQFVTVGDTRGDQAAITRGLAKGDVIVTAGQIKLHNNEQVQVSNTVTMPDNPTPHVPDE